MEPKDFTWWVVVGFKIYFILLSAKSWYTYVYIGIVCCLKKFVLYFYEIQQQNISMPSDISDRMVVGFITTYAISTYHH